MKNLGFTSILVFSLTMPQLATAQSASGNYRFLLEDDLFKTVEFQADERGGSMAFADEAKIVDGDDVEDPRRGDAIPVYVKVDFDDLTVEKNRALMSGYVLDSSHKSFFGTLVQLVVEDNVENPRVPDRLTWVFCKPRERGWVPTDAEVKGDDGAYLRWWATDAERKDDVGIPSQDLLSNAGDCPIFPVWEYALVDPNKWEGDIVVKP
ncbi:MAG: hypothetical protein QOH06_1451 [Acidobacteriota bacterium]|jgi:hypothetical protein|nr:hypothetical protein [Acidobacteriota bacterium]